MVIEKRLHNLNNIKFRPIPNRGCDCECHNPPDIMIACQRCVMEHKPMTIQENRHE